MSDTIPREKGAIDYTDDMAKNGIYILEDLERLQQFKQNALAHAKRFSLENVLPDYKEVYREVIADCC